MASLLICNSNWASPTLHLPTTTPPRAYFRPSLVPFCQGFGFSRSKARGWTVLSRAGPSTSSYVFAFVLPLSLLAITVFASVRVADRLDEKYLEELILDEAMREGAEGDDDSKDNEEEDDDDDAEVSVEKLQKPVLPRRRNRPKREA